MFFSKCPTCQHWRYRLSITPSIRSHFGSTDFFHHGESIEKTSSHRVFLAIFHGKTAIGCFACYLLFFDIIWIHLDAFGFIWMCLKRSDPIIDYWETPTSMKPAVFWRGGILHAGGVYPQSLEIALLQPAPWLLVNVDGFHPSNTRIHHQHELVGGFNPFEKY